MSVCTKHKCYNTTELIFQKELMLIKQIHQKNVILVAIGILKILLLSMSNIFAMVVMIWCKKLSFNDVAIVYVKGSAYRSHFWCMNKIMQLA